MYLSQIQLNPRRREAARVLGSPHVLHAAVQAAFPDPAARESGRVLWRLDTTDRSTRLYIVSPERPDLTHLAEQAGWPSIEDSWSVRPYGPLLERIAPGQRYAFRLTANPVHNERLPHGRRGKVYGHVTATQQEQWLLDRQERLGFSVENAIEPESGLPFPGPSGEPEKALTVRDRRTLSFSRRETTVTLRVATYEGLLTVTDRTAFAHALSFGIGRAKGYGCGLMTLARVG
ncbi:type I-E CRISPR-associated protein Cas6/Cse3/CasE [Microbacterium tumbae]